MASRNPTYPALKKRSLQSFAAKLRKKFKEVLKKYERKQYEIQNEKHCANPNDGVYFFDFLATDLDDTVGDKSKCHTVRDVVAQTHKYPGEEGGDGLIKATPIDILK